MVNDVEKDVFDVAYVKGYPSLAAFIASDQDKSTAIYRRFDRLSARNLLYLQSELQELEARQDALDAEDLQGDRQAKKSARNWQVLKTRAKQQNNEKEKERLELVFEIRDKLKEYREAVLLESTLLSMRRPSKRTFEAFYNVFHNVGGTEEPFPTLGGASAKILDDRDDLMALHRPAEEDRLTTIVRQHFHWLFRTKTPSRSDSLAYFSENRIYIFVGAVNILLAAVLLFGAIYNLYYVTNEQRRLGLIAGYTVAFALCVGLLTNARRSEVFGACAAYAAVLVVFVSGSLGTGGAGGGTASTVPAGVG